MKSWIGNQLRKSSILHDSVVSPPSRKHGFNKNWLGRKYPVVKRRYWLNPVVMREKIEAFNEIWASGETRLRALKAVGITWSSYRRWAEKLGLLRRARGPRPVYSVERRNELLGLLQKEVFRTGDVKAFMSKHGVGLSVLGAINEKVLGHRRLVRPKALTKQESLKLYFKVKTECGKGESVVQVCARLGVSPAMLAKVRKRYNLPILRRLHYEGVPDSKARRLVATICFKVSDGRTLDAACRSVGWSMDRFYHYRRRFGISWFCRSISRAELTARIRRLDKYCSEGYFIAEAAKMVGLSAGSIRYFRSKLEWRGEGGEQRQSFLIKDPNLKMCSKKKKRKGS